MIKPPKTYTREVALQVMAELCARSEQCEADLREKMRRHSVSATDADTVINYLYEHNFLNELRYATAYTRDKHRFNLWGRNKIRAMLSLKRIPRDVIHQALDSISETDYFEHLMRLLTTKSKKLDLTAYEDRQKLMRSLYARGFEPELIFRGINTIISQSE